jgi:hypothetical protein
MKRRVCVSGAVIFYESVPLTWSVTVREEYSVFVERMPRGIFGFNTQEVRGRCRKLHTEQCRNF